MKKTINIIIVVVIVLILVGGAYWYFAYYSVSDVPTTIGTDITTPNGFVPIGRTVSPPPPVTNTGASTSTIPNNVVRNTPLPVLRLLSNTPVGGYGASTTASTSAIRWIDRGRGNIFEARGDNLDIITISNTLIPRMYETIWNTNVSSFIGQYLDNNTDEITTAIANITKRNTNSTASTTGAVEANVTPYELKGKIVSGNVIAMATSPKKDRVLMVSNKNDRAVGYISNFDGSKQTQLFDLPFTKMTAEWPEENTIAITTNASAYYSGYLYFLNAKTGAMKQILANTPGLTTKVSKDATKVLYSSTAGKGGRVTTSLYDIKNNKTSSIIFRTIADKCAWSAKFKEQVYCGVPSQISEGVFPDDWYLGKLSTVDAVWMLDANTGEINEVADLLDIGKTIIDIYKPSLDNTDDFLYFINKNDLSLWSLDLVSSN